MNEHNTQVLPKAEPPVLTCPDCGSPDVEREDYLNPCAQAACKLNGPVTYHLGCGSQWKEYCLNCGALLFDSAQDEIDYAEWDEVQYACTACQDKVEPGHFACGTTFRVPRDKLN